MTSKHLHELASRYCSDSRAGRVVFAALIVGASLLVATPGTSVAAPAQAIAVDDDLNWSVQPSGPNGPGARSEFSFKLAPGETHSDFVGVTNRSTEEKVFKIYSTDAFTASDGGFALLTASQPPRGVGAWAGLASQGYPIPPGTRLEVPFTVSVPSDATPGDHAGGIVASLTTTTTNAEGQTVTIDQRVGARVYLRVDGPTTPAVQVSVVQATYANPLIPFGGGPMSVTYKIRNTGNLRITGNAAVQIKGLGLLGLAKAAGIEVKEILPGSEITATRTFPGVFPAGLLTAEVTLDPKTAEGPLSSVSGSASVWAMPWLLLGIIIVVAAGGLLLWLRRRGRTPVASTPAATPTSEDGSSGSAQARDNEPANVRS